MSWESIEQVLKNLDTQSKQKSRQTKSRQTKSRQTKNLKDKRYSVSLEAIKILDDLRLEGISLSNFLRIGIDRLYRMEPYMNVKILLLLNSLKDLVENSHDSNKQEILQTIESLEKYYASNTKQKRIIVKPRLKENKHEINLFSIKRS